MSDSLASSTECRFMRGMLGIKPGWVRVSLALLREAKNDIEFVLF